MHLLFHLAARRIFSGKILLGTPQGASPASPSATELTIVLRTCILNRMRKIQNAALTMLCSFAYPAALSLTIAVVRSGRRTRIRRFALSPCSPKSLFSALKLRGCRASRKIGTSPNARRYIQLPFTNLNRTIYKLVLFS